MIYFQVLLLLLLLLLQKLVSLYLQILTSSVILSKLILILQHLYIYQLIILLLVRRASHLLLENSVLLHLIQADLLGWDHKSVFLRFAVITFKFPRPTVSTNCTPRPIFGVPTLSFLAYMLSGFFKLGSISVTSKVSGLLTSGNFGFRRRAFLGRVALFSI